MPCSAGCDAARGSKVCEVRIKRGVSHKEPAGLEQAGGTIDVEGVLDYRALPLVQLADKQVVRDLEDDFSEARQPIMIMPSGIPSTWARYPTQYHETMPLHN